MTDKRRTDISCYRVTSPLKRDRNKRHKWNGELDREKEKRSFRKRDRLIEKRREIIKKEKERQKNKI